MQGIPSLLMPLEAPCREEDLGSGGENPDESYSPASQFCFECVNWMLSGGTQGSLTFQAHAFLFHLLVGSCPERQMPQEKNDDPG